MIDAGAPSVLHPSPRATVITQQAYTEEGLSKGTYTSCLWPEINLIHSSDTMSNLCLPQIASQSTIASISHFYL